MFGNLSSSCEFQLIFSSEYTKAMDQDWHTSHFACFQCDIALTGHRYVLRDDHAYCIHCYEKLFAHTCEECKTLIGTDSKVFCVAKVFEFTLLPGFPSIFCRLLC